MKLLQINSIVNSGSTGRIAEDIGRVVMQHGHQSYIAFGRGNRPSASKTIKTGNKLHISLHGLKTRLFDLHGFGSKKATRKLTENLKEINPDIIHLHNLHGYYLNVEELFNYLKQAGKRVVWTFHDCWPFTGHCSHFDGVNCFKWQTECHTCPNRKGYPASWVVDNSRNNFNRKRALFTGVENLTIITPSHWLAGHVKNSFLKEYPVQVIHNGIDLDAFHPGIASGEERNYAIPVGQYILGVANIWSARKGLVDFIRLRELLPPDIQIALVGLSPRQQKGLPEGIKGIARTESIQELAALYCSAAVYVNPTYVDNFPTTNLEALACGTPVITYNTGGSPEAVDEKTGRVVEKGDIKGLVHAINEVCAVNRNIWRTHCRSRAEIHFDKDRQFLEYLKIYEQLLSK